LKELGSNAEPEARELYEAKEDNKNAMDQVYGPFQIDEMNSGLQSPVRVPQSPEEFFLSLLPDKL
jgi:hypothetical protein